MVSLTKQEILESLERFSRIIEQIAKNPNSSSGIFLLSSNNYLKDYRVYQMISSLRCLSYYEDAFLDKITNDELQIENTIFVNPSDYNRFSKKQIIKYIRNAFSHSEKEKELYKISKNGRYVEIKLQNTKPIPFHVKMSLEQLQKIIATIQQQQNLFYMSIMDFEHKSLKRVYLKENGFLPLLPDAFVCR